ncbi:MAG: SGNH/GDSL hydrolase family protein, partial [Planctomycetota bacterium]
MTPFHVFAVLAIVLAGALTAPTAVGEPPAGETVVYETDFETDPLEAGWKLDVKKKDKKKDEKPPRPWTDAGTEWEGHALHVAAGNVDSPELDAEPGAYYLISFDARTTEKSYWAVFFRDAEGELIVSDVYDVVLPNAGEAWRKQTSVIRVHPDAERMFVRFHPTEAGVDVDNLSVRRVPTERARLWLDNIAAENPFIRYQPPADRGRHIPRTMQTLREGGELRVVMLGDSICNDTSNSLYEVLLMEACPKTDIEVVTSVRGSTGCTYYQHENRVQEYVLQYDPDLLIIAGISHGYDPEAMRNVIRQVREKSDCETLVLSGAVTPHAVMHSRAFWYVEMVRKRKKYDPEELRRRIANTLNAAATFPRRLREMCRAEKVEYFDIRAAWDAYIDRSWRPQEEMMRDNTHANRFGKQVVGR